VLNSWGSGTAAGQLRTKGITGDGLFKINMGLAGVGTPDNTYAGAWTACPVPCISDAIDVPCLAKCKQQHACVLRTFRQPLRCLHCHVLRHTISAVLKLVSSVCINAASCYPAEGTQTCKQPLTHLFVMPHRLIIAAYITYTMFFLCAYTQ
jgi:hypothetical protein